MQLAPTCALDPLLVVGRQKIGDLESVSAPMKYPPLVCICMSRLYLKNLKGSGSGGSPP